MASQPSSQSSELATSNEPSSSSGELVDNSSQIMEQIARLYADRLLSDITIKVGTQHFSVHRLILCASSDVFQIMLMDRNWSESTESVIELQEDHRCEPIFPNFLKYLYTGLIRMSCDIVLPLLILADKYNVKHLITLCLDYMSSHLIQACTSNVLLSWLHYCQSCSHKEIAAKCQKFILLNFEFMTHQDEFSHIDPEILLDFLKHDDLVVKDEMTLFRIVTQWLLNYEKRINGSSYLNEKFNFEETVRLFARVIRFPMMSSRELASLLLNQLVKRFNHIFVEYMSNAMSFHDSPDGCAITKPKKRSLKNDLSIHPRLYTNEKWSSSFVIDSYSNLPIYGTRSLVFTTPQSLFDRLCSCGLEHFPRTESAESRSAEIARKKTKLCNERDHEWVVELYPKGIWFRRCMTIRWWGGNLEIPEVVIKTVRLSVTLANPCISNGLENSEKALHKRVRVAVLIYSCHENFEFVEHTRVQTITFCEDDPVLLMNDLIPYDELNLSSIQQNMSQGSQQKPKTSPFLVGTDRNTLKMQVIITPLEN